VVDSSVLAVDLAGVSGVVRTSSGAVVVAEQGAASLLVLRPGIPPIHLGRRGSGPGEFGLLYRVHLCPTDSIVVHDYDGRIHLFSDTGFLRTILLPPRLSAAEFLGCPSADTLAFAKLPDRIPGMGLHLMPITVFGYAMSTANVQWRATLRGTEMFISERYSALYERPFGAQTLLAAGRSGVATAETGRRELRLIVEDGGFETLYFLPSESRGTSQKARTRYLKERLAEEPDSASRVTLRKILDEAPWGDYLPEVDRLLASQSGAFWLRRSPSAVDSLAEWLVISRDSPIIQRIFLDRSLRLQFVDDTRILALQETSDGYERLRELVFKGITTAPDTSR